jgi:hypothetical protein
MVRRPALPERLPVGWSRITKMPASNRPRLSDFVCVGESPSNFLLPPRARPRNRSRACLPVTVSGLPDEPAHELGGMSWQMEIGLRIGKI